MYTKLIVSLFAILLISSVGSVEVIAQEKVREPESSRSAQLEFDVPIPEGGINLTVSPISLVLETDPGKSTTAEVKIRNNGTETEYLSPQLATFSAAGSSENIQIRPFEENEDYQEWLQFETDLVQVRPGEWQSITVTFDPPEEASLDYYYMLLFKRVAEETDEGESLIAGAPGIFALAHVKTPNAIRQLTLSDFSVPKVFFEYLPITFTATVKNTGNTYLAPTGNIFIDSQSDKDIAVLSLNASNSYVLPESERNFQAIWNEGFPLKKRKEVDGKDVQNNGEIVYELDWDFSQANKFRIGKYTANIIMVYDNGERDVPTESQVSFWVIPWRLIVVAILIPVLPAVFVFLITKWWMGRQRD